MSTYTLSVATIRLTAEQKQNFCDWAITKYSSYDEYKKPAEEIAVYIRTHIFTMELKSIWRETEPYVGIKSGGDLRTSRFQGYRKELNIKIKYMKEKLGKLAFPEAAAILRVSAEQRRLQRQIGPPAVVHHYYVENMQVNPLPRIMKSLSNDEANECMEDHCAICLVAHLMVDSCVVNCGHRFGATCFAKGNLIDKRCPLCRTVCTEVTEFTLRQD